MFRNTKWDEWPCTHDCTSFFTIPVEEIAPLVPAPLTLATDAAGRGRIEIGYARFSASHSLPALQELSWGIAVERRSGRGMAFYCPSLTSDHAGFLDYNEAKAFDTYRPPVRFDTDFDARSFSVRDADGAPICVLRHQPEGSVRLPSLLEPFFLGTTEVWTGHEGSLQRRIFKWRGVARVRFASPVACSLYDHPFFGTARVSRAEPVPYEQFSSSKVARATQLFTLPQPM